LEFISKLKSTAFGQAKKSKMAPGSRFSTIALALVVAIVCLRGSVAQKTAQRWNSNAQQSVGNNQQSAYGGYEAQQQQQLGFNSGDSQRQQPATPVNQRGRSNQGYQSQQAPRPASRPEQPVIQQQESSYESSASSSEADAEPAQYGK